jgi:hypothetical protein
MRPCPLLCTTPQRTLGERAARELAERPLIGAPGRLAIAGLAVGEGDVDQGDTSRPRVPPARRPMPGQFDGAKMPEVRAASINRSTIVVEHGGDSGLTRATNPTANPGVTP